MTDRVDLLEERVAALAAALAGLEARLSRLERAPGPARSEGGAAGMAAERAAEPEEPLVVDEGTAPAILGGRALLGVGGAYLVRALTDAGTVPRVAGIALGLAYAGAWLFAADRSGRRGRTADATVHAFLALVTALPLLWEATVRLGAIPPLTAAVLLAAVGGAIFAVAWRHDLTSVAWGATLGAVGTAWGLLLATTRIELFSILLIAFGAATLWTTYGRRWHALRWPAAFGADLAILTIVYLGTRRGGPPEAYADLKPGRAAFVALLLFVVYTGSFAARTLARRREVNVFEALQTAAVLLVGYGGAVRLAQAAESGEQALGVAALVLAGLGYAAAFGFVGRDATGGRNFLFFSSLALVLALTGGGLLAAGPSLGSVWAAFGLAAAVFGARYGRRSLEAHGAAYLAAAGFPCGLFSSTAGAFSGATGAGDVALPASAAGVALVSAIAWRVALGRRGSGPPDGGSAFSRAVLLSVAAAGAGAAAVAALVRILPGEAIPARTAVLAVAAVLLAFLRARLGAEEAGWLAWAVLGGAAFKLFLQDFPGGRPVTLFAAFVLCGLSLMAVSRILRRRPLPR